MTPPSTDCHRRLVLAVFACACLVYAPPVSADETEASTEDAADPERAPVCDTPLKLGATFYLHDQPDQSLAMFRAPKTQLAGLYRRGMYVEGFEVISVEPRGVLLAREDAYCWLRLQPDPSRPQPTPPKRPRRKPKSKR